MAVQFQTLLQVVGEQWVSDQVLRRVFIPLVFGLFQDHVPLVQVVVAPADP